MAENIINQQNGDKKVVFLKDPKLVVAYLLVLFGILCLGLLLLNTFTGFIADYSYSASAFDVLALSNNVDLILLTASIASLSAGLLLILTLTKKPKPLTPLLSEQN